MKHVNTVIAYSYNELPVIISVSYGTMSHASLDLSNIFVCLVGAV